MCKEDLKLNCNNSAQGNKNRLRDLDARARRLTESLQDCWPLHDGSITVQLSTCGKSTCACHKDKSKRHGPYATWTTKIKGKTVAKRFDLEHAEVIRTWIENRRRLDRITKELIAVSKEMLPLLLEAKGRESAG